MNLQNTVGGWLSYGFSAKRAVHDLVALHLSYQNARGHGNKARRRAESLRKGIIRLERLNADGSPQKPGDGPCRHWLLHGTGLN